jgi:NAD(P)H-hydrate epimerase
MANAIAIGPGMGISQKNIDILAYILHNYNKILVIDADALNSLSNIKECLKKTSAKVIITPHPGEMSRLTGLCIDEINSGRLKIAREFAREYNCTVLLKGASTVVSDGENTYINTTGNPGMASGGSGDVLTGIVAAIAAQGYNVLEACILGSFIHGKSGDEAYKIFGNGLTASDIIDYLGKSFNGSSEASLPASAGPI